MNEQLAILRSERVEQNMRVLNRNVEEIVKKRGKE